MTIPAPLFHTFDGIPLFAARSFGLVYPRKGSRFITHKWGNSHTNQKTCHVFHGLLAFSRIFLEPPHKWLKVCFDTLENISKTVLQHGQSWDCVSIFQRSNAWWLGFLPIGFISPGFILSQGMRHHSRQTPNSAPMVSFVLLAPQCCYSGPFWWYKNVWMSKSVRLVVGKIAQVFNNTSSQKTQEISKILRLFCFWLLGDNMVTHVAPLLYTTGLHWIGLTCVTGENFFVAFTNLNQCPVMFSTVK